MGRKFNGTICRNQSVDTECDCTETHSSNVFFVELRPDDCGLHKVFDVGHSRETTK